jgi:hypothetical protein
MGKKKAVVEEESCECDDCQEEIVEPVEVKKKKSIVPAILIGIAVIAIILYILGII